MSNYQIHNNLCLTVENSIEIGKGYQVIEKWVFFKLLFQILQTDSSGGKNHTTFKWYKHIKDVSLRFVSNIFVMHIFSIPVVYNISGVAMNFLDAVKVIMELYDKQVM